MILCGLIEQAGHFLTPSYLDTLAKVIFYVFVQSVNFVSYFYFPNLRFLRCCDASSEWIEIVFSGSIVSLPAKKQSPARVSSVVWSAARAI